MGACTLILEAAYYFKANIVSWVFGVMIYQEIKTIPQPHNASTSNFVTYGYKDITFLVNKLIQSNRKYVLEL